ncbi:MAG: TonB-dependent receptor, partial [Emcibacter sp.]|nr:TonB-dependent receptor [Emcibacter sp.]
MKFTEMTRRPYIYANLLFISAAVSMPAIAAEGDRGIEEVVVTAQQREQNLQEVPISISAFTSDAIEKNMFSDVTEYITRTPNASFISNGAKSRRRISIRGITNSLPDSDAIRTSTFGFYVDGFNIAGSSINPPIMDIERIEVLRGPQATYFGRNAIGGGISITSKKPENELSGSVMADYSSFNTWDLEGVINLPIVEDVFAARINGKYSKTDGNIKNINPLGGGNDSEYKYIKVSFRLTPSENLTIDLTGTYADELAGMREGVPSGVFSAFAGDVLFASFPDRDGDGKADPAIDGIGFFPENRNRANFNSPQEVGTNFKYVVGTIQYDMENISFKSITGYIESDFFLRGDIDGGSRDFFNEFRTVPRDSFSQEIRVQNTDDGPLLWNIGFLYAKDNGKSENRTFVGDEEPFGIPSGGAIDSSDENGEKTNWSVFGQADWSVTEKLTLSVGGRYSSEKVETIISGFSGATITNVSLNKTFKDFSPRFAASYAVSEDMNIYATVSKGFKSGGVQVSPFPGAESFAPETLWNYEVGLKADFLDNRVRMNLSAFYMNWTDLQTAFQQAGTDSEGNLTLFGGIDNAEKATSKGFE